MTQQQQTTGAPTPAAARCWAWARRWPAPRCCRPAPRRAAAAKGAFPKGFLWGAAIAGHQAEGDNVASDAWFLENIQPTEFKEPSGSGVDHYRLYDQDIATCWPRSA
jgi:hypothetical protein